jgi:hypothetical protein
MYLNAKAGSASAILVLIAFIVGIQAKVTPPKAREAANKSGGVLWRDPVDIAARNLFYGPGGQAHEPHGTFTFQKEDTSGTSPKFDVIDQDGVRWRVKMGPEARPETAASRLVWAVGYLANEDYFLPVLHVEEMQHLRRGRNFVSANNNVCNVRLKRHLKDEEKIGSWSWAKNPFTGTREWFGLRVLMALMNNWDLKDSNTSIYLSREKVGEERYVVSDLGASFGPTGLNWALKGDPRAYCRSKWIKAVSPEFVDFNVPSGPTISCYILLPELAHQFSMGWLGRHIPRPYARWMGDLLARLSPDQVRDAFRSAGYSAQEVEQLATVVERRIAELERL